MRACVVLFALRLRWNPGASRANRVAFAYLRAASFQGVARGYIDLRVQFDSTFSRSALHAEEFLVAKPASEIRRWHRHCDSASAAAMGTIPHRFTAAAYPSPTAAAMNNVAFRIRALACGFD